MEIVESLKFNLISKLLYILVLFTEKTINLEIRGEENLERFEGDFPLIISYWHRYLWIPIFYFRDRGYMALVSSSDDGDLITSILEKYGWQTVRGSSTRGGSRSLLRLYRRLKEENNVAIITPDGPTGPAYHVKPGIIYLQEKSEGYIIPTGFAVDRKITVDTWDRLVLPLPWTKAVIQLGEPVRFSKDESREKRCERLEDKMKNVQQEAQKRLKLIKKNGG